MPTYMDLIREIADKLDKDFRGNLDFAIAELYNLSLRLQKEKEGIKLPHRSWELLLV